MSESSLAVGESIFLGGGCPSGRLSAGLRGGELLWPDLKVLSPAECLEALK
jgi:hypothetical protein